MKAFGLLFERKSSAPRELGIFGTRTDPYNLIYNSVCAMAFEINSF